MTPTIDDKDEAEIASKLKGTTLRVFWFASSQQKVGVREVQRALELSSPSVASYHLEKLCNLGLAEKDLSGQYQIIKKVNVGALRNYFKIKNWLVPRWIFYALFFTVIFLSYAIFFFRKITIANIFILIFGLGTMIIFWTETILAFIKRPF
jgi:DNA-binding transcriptional ArsR family regulator